jgi:cold shock CspA family protein
MQLPRGGFAFLALARLYLHARRDLPAAGQALVEALRRLRPAEPLVRLELARMHLALDRPRAALRQAERALACRRDSAFVDGLRLAAELAERCGQVTQAVEYLRQLTQLLPDDPEAAARAEQLAHAPDAATPRVDASLPAALAFLDDAALEAPGDDRLVGVISRFFPEKGFGFVHYDGGQSIFFHVTQCEDAAADLVPGTRVSFRLGHNPKKGKPQAEVVRRV